MNRLLPKLLLALALLFITTLTLRAEKPTAVTAIFSYYDALRSIGGDDVTTIILLPPGASPHDYEPTVKDRATATRAQLLVANGLNIDKWMVKLAADTPSAITLNIGDLVAKNGIQPLHTAETSLTDPKDRKPEAAEDDTAGNPHIWLDPRVQAMAAEAIRDALEKIDPTHADGYKQRAAAYLKQLADLDQDFAAAAATFKQKDFIGFHSAYEYLARRYGLHQVASVEELPGEGPTISQTVAIIRLIKAKDIHVIFTENAFPAKAADMIVRETNVTTGVLQPLETYDDLKQTYVGLMRENLEAFKKALQ
jgi:zinc transport system substrate-binding protein